MVQSSAVNGPPRQDSPGAGKRGLKRVLNVRLLAVTLIAVAILGPAAYFLYSYKVERNKEALLQVADGEAKGDKWGAAAGYLYRYLQLDPGNAEVRVRFEEAFDRSANSRGGKEQAIQH